MRRLPPCALNRHASGVGEERQQFIDTLLKIVRSPSSTAEASHAEWGIRKAEDAARRMPDQTAEKIEGWKVLAVLTACAHVQPPSRRS
eukprot:CAMPEP_0119393122 /NCGR_PEP_ID=MMETSP1334-20130426/124300_1 /TAXON_ID=127549 /ORGANISM="Calcidiscus leptoporus, Strain RCC1130" /LENGTH=87 /DNA_ID=CAMNT_0007416127 /DNA_START=114 /DNA_END=373 /DNA_ORIENTATION=-